MDVKDAITAIRLNYPPENYTALREGLDLAMELLEKQIPQKPIALTYRLLLDHGWKQACPCCGCAVGVNNHAYDYTQEDDYCSQCGQTLDWE